MADQTWRLEEARHQELQTHSCCTSHSLHSVALETLVAMARGPLMETGRSSRSTSQVQMIRPCQRQAIVGPLVSPLATIGFVEWLQKYSPCEVEECPSWACRPTYLVP